MAAARQRARRLAQGNCRRRQDGSALLLVLGATAALSALALATLSVALVAYEVAALEQQGAQARLLARSGVDLVARELAAGSLPLPGAGVERTWQPSLPPPPQPGLPPLQCTLQVRLSLLPAAPGVSPAAPASPPQAASSPAPAPSRLVDALAEASCGRGFQRRAARFAVAADGTITRLY